MLSTVMVFVILMGIGMILLTIWYINKGYSYKHTIDEIDEDLAQLKEKNK
jgi:hypothetical protein